MKFVFLSKYFSEESEKVSDSQPQIMESVEIEEEETCDVCSEEVTPDMSWFPEDFVWHPQKKF